MTFEKTRELESRYLMPTFGRSQVQFVSGDGMTLTDSEGKTYTDFLAGIAVCCLGHSHPVMVNAIKEQAEKLLHVSNYFYIEHRAELAELISRLANDEFNLGVQEDAPVWKTFFSNSGAESNECAMKLARLKAKREGRTANTIVCMRGGFHGRTLETVAATMQDWLQEPFQPLPGGFLPCTPNDITELEQIFKQHGSEICAVMLEPIQGESGVHPMTQEFMQAVRDLTIKHNALMICDEVQTGIFRCGKPFAFQVYGITPDIFSMAKGIGGGMVMGACAAKAEIADVYRPGDHGTTFGGSPLACATSLAVLRELVDGKYDTRVAEMGAYFKKKLAALPQVAEARGEGLLVGCDLIEGMPDSHDVVKQLLDAGFVINATGGGKTLRFLPPLICKEQHIDALVDALATVLPEA